MGSRAARTPAVEQVLGVLAGGLSTTNPLEELVQASGRSVGATLAALIRLQSIGRVEATRAGYALTPHAAPLPSRAAARLVPAGRVDHRPRQLRAGPRAVIDFAVAGFGFRDASRYRDELRLVVAGYSTAGQWVQAGSTVVLRWMLWRCRSCHFGRHTFVIRHDSSTSVGATYLECAVCGAFSSALFGDAVDRYARRLAASSS